MRGQIAALLRLDASQTIDRRGRLMELGLDSLMAVELRARLGRGLPLARPLPATLIFDHPTVDAIVALLLRLMEPEPTAPAAALAVPTRFSAASPDEIDALSDEEVEARLLARLQQFEEHAP